MHRRLLLAALACGPAALTHAQEGPAPARPHHRISAGRLHEALERKFPVRLDLAGLLGLEIRAPRLLLLPARNKLGATLVAQAGAPGRQALPPGELDLVFALRYEPSDRTLRAHQAEVLDLRLPGVRAEHAELLRRVLPRLAREGVGEFVLHQLTPRELALPDAMGFEPGPITVQGDGLRVEFVRKVRP